jgi:rhamnosyltransferase
LQKNIIDVAVVTLFHPDQKVLTNIKSYLPYVKELLVIDNSEMPSDLSLLQREFSSITLLASGTNLGISKAMNLAINYAKHKGYSWMLTMDQDSSFDSLEIEKFIRLFYLTVDKNLAIFVPLHNKKFLKEEEIYNQKECCVMTSANIININKALTIGGFDENLFIDEVDHEFCLRLKKAGYSIIQNHNCYLHHVLGTKHKELNINLYSSHRLYYMIRNYLYVRNKHKKIAPNFFKKRDFYLFKFFIKQILYTKQKKKYIRMLFFGVKDYHRNYMGYRVKL